MDVLKKEVTHKTYPWGIIDVCIERDQSWVRYQKQNKIKIEHSIRLTGSLSMYLLGWIQNNKVFLYIALHFILSNIYFLKISNLFPVCTEVYNLHSWFWNCSITPKPRKMYHSILKKRKNTVIFSSFIIMLIYK